MPRSCAASARASATSHSGPRCGPRPSWPSCSSCGRRCSTATTPVEGLEVVFACVGGSFAACGIVAWHRRPDSHTGALMTATGFAFFLPRCSASSGPRSAPRSPRCSSTSGASSSSRCSSRCSPPAGSRRGVDRLLVFGFVLPLLILGFAWLLFTEEVDDNLLLAFPDKGVADAIDSAQRAILIAACVGTVVVLGARWRAASRPRRRALLPTVAGSFVLLIYTALLINDLVSGRSLAAAAVDRLVLARHRPARVPRRPAALAARARLPLRPVPRPAHRARGGAAGDARPGAGRPQPGRRLRPAARPQRRALRRPGRARRAPVRLARLRPVGRRRPRARRGGHRRDRDRARERAAPRGVRGPASPSCRPRASGSSRPATRSGGGSSATCTTARSSAWSRSPCSCG